MIKFYRMAVNLKLAVGEATIKFKSVKSTRIKGHMLCTYVSYLRVRVRVYYMYGRRELPPNLNPPRLLFRPLGTKPPSLKIANISGCTVFSTNMHGQLEI